MPMNYLRVILKRIELRSTRTELLRLLCRSQLFDAVRLYVLNK